jgi:hypothetical protein
MPFALCVTVGSKPGLEQRSVFRSADQVANVTTKIGGKVRRVFDEVAKSAARVGAGVHEA